ncbi:PREDICTED: putative neutral sphingomyelinase isoform X1 [Polistes dominula]|uniref:sphingomyelin phosphodiesterase n=1 Tax=Polistes dominula TaxID=743375 RepID=A0ABM1J082_POLDO|nr:PREDICTED: putative neutral sphingomyelinase isoform X1 [Polistes dominula]
MMSREITINVLSLNCWGIPYVSKNRKARMEAIAEKLSTGEYDIISLQEVWSVNDFKMIRSKVKEQLPYSHYFHSGVLGSGICIFSKYCIEDVMFHRWPLNGYFHKIHHGDWFGGKGVGLCKIKVEDMSVNVYAAHLHAEYNKVHDEYKSHRVLQAFDTAQFIRMTSGGSDVVILGGDLNAEPQDLAYRIICGVAGLMDACSSNFGNVGTDECANNSYTSARVARKCPEGKRIDHILYFGSSNVQISAINYQQPLPKRVPNTNFSYSDHEAIMASLKLTNGVHEKNNIDVRETLKEAIGICESAISSLRSQYFWYLLAVCILIVPVIWSMGLDYTTTSIGISIALNIGRLFLTALLCYALFMSVIWNNTENKALEAGCLAMEIHLIQLTNKLSN